MTVLTLPRTDDLKLGFLSPHTPHNRSAFSGSAFFAARALAQRPSVDLRILGHRPPTTLERLFHRRPADINIDQIDLDGLDAVIGLVATPLLNALHDRRPDLPFLHVTDATPAFLREVYGWAVPRQADLDEARVTAQAHAVVYSSDVMAKRAQEEFGPVRSAVLPFGINFETTQTTPPQKQSLDKLNLLFVGIDWVRKGGDVAVAALDLLRAGGHDATLTVVGRCPERHRHHPAINAVGFLNKNRPRERARLAELYKAAHLLLLPTRGDCTPMVIPEAMAHGTPVLASDTGGIAALIGGTGAGRLLPLHDTPAAWAAAILSMTSTQDRYGFLSDACLDRAHSYLCWENWAAGIEEIARQARQSAAHVPQRGAKVAMGA